MINISNKLKKDLFYSNCIKDFKICHHVEFQLLTYCLLYTSIFASIIIYFSQLFAMEMCIRDRYLIENTLKPNDDKKYESYGVYENHPEYGKIIKLQWREISTEEYVPTKHDIRVEALREKYRQTTRLLCQLAEVEIRDKLEDTEYETTVIAAMNNNPEHTTILTQTIMYCFFQLKLEDGIDAWIRI